MVQISDYPIYWNMVQVFVKNFWKKLVGRVLAIGKYLLKILIKWHFLTICGDTDNDNNLVVNA